MSFENPKVPNNNESKVVSIEGYKKENEKILRAKEIMGRNFLGRREIEKAFGIKINPESVPEIPFSREDLERANELNQFLILRIDEMPNGEPLTVGEMNKLLKGKVNDGGKTLFYDDGSGNIEDSGWYKNEDFITKEVPKLSWALVSKEIIPNSSSKNYLEQTDEVVGYLKNQVFKDKTTPVEFESAILEYEESKEEIKTLLKTDWGKAAEKLSDLKITKLTRQSSVEAFYDLIVYFQNKGERLLKDEPRFTWTSSRTLRGELIRAGFFTPNGISFSSSGPDGTDSYLGVLFSRIR